MERISETLYLPVKIQRGRPCAVETESFQKFGLLLSDVTTERNIAEVLFESWRHFQRSFDALFDELESYGLPRPQPTIQDNLNAECQEVEVPGLDEQIQERDAIFARYVEDIRIKKLENTNAHLFTAAIAESSE